MMGNRNTAAFVIAGAALLAASPALADVKAGVDAWTRGDFAAAVKEWQGPAGKGDPDAQFNLGQAYKLGRGVKQDLTRAEDLFGRAAAQGHPQASDNYGLLLFQRGERARALPYVQTAAGRGDPRAQYLLGIAHFNGDGVPKDWVRAYALTSMAQQAGLGPAASALAQMDQHIPLEQRQQAATLASDLQMRTEAARARQLAAADLGNKVPGSVPTSSARPSIASAESAIADAVRMAGADSPRTAGADYARPKDPQPPIAAARPALGSPPASAQRPPLPAVNRPAPPPPPSRPPASAQRSPAPATAAPRPAPAPAPAATGSWRVQLGAFGVPGNAEALWNKVKGRPELSGHGRLLVPAGKVTKLQAGGFASRAEAQAACAGLSAAGFTCIPARN